MTAGNPAAFPEPNLNPAALPWARRIMQRLTGLEGETDRHADGIGDLGATMLSLVRRKADRGALVFKGEWAFDLVEDPGLPRIWGGYVENFSYPGIPPHAFSPYDGLFVIPWVYGDGSPADVTVTISATYVYDIPDDYVYVPGTNNFLNVAVYAPGGLELNGDVASQFTEGAMDALARRQDDSIQPGHHEIHLTATAAVTAQGTWGLQLATSGYPAAGAWVSASISAAESSAPANVWRPGQLPTPPGPPRQAGRPYVAGDAVTYRGALWAALTTTDTQPPAPGQWEMIAPTPADSFAGEWGP